MIVTYSLFLAVMRLREMRDAGYLIFWPHPVRYVIAYTILIAGLLADVALNWIWFTIIGLEVPHEFLSTARLNRWYGESVSDNILNKWRREVAWYYGDEFLNDADPDGKHIHG